MDDFSKRLETVRESFKLNKSEFSRRLNLKSTYYSDILRGDRPINIKLILKVYEEFSVNLHWLLTGLGGKFIENEDLFNDDALYEYHEINPKDILKRIQKTIGKYDDHVPFDEDFYPKDYYSKLINGEIPLTLRTIIAMNSCPVDFHWLITGHGKQEISGSFIEKHMTGEDFGFFLDKKHNNMATLDEFSTEEIHAIFTQTENTLPGNYIRALHRFIERSHQDLAILVRGGGKVSKIEPEKNKQKDKNSKKIS